MFNFISSFQSVSIISSGALIMCKIGFLFLSYAVVLFYVHCTPYTSDCNDKLLENRESVPDSSFSQSSFEDNFKGKYVRDSSNEDQAWCPLKKTGTYLREFVSIDLGQLCVIKMIMTRGRNAVGYVSAQSYFIKYKQENESQWKFYHNYSRSKELIARKDPLNENFISLEPPLIARWLRVFPYQPTNEKICLKLQLYGCINTNHVVEYQMIDGSKYQHGMGSSKFKDTTYDGKLGDNGTLFGGVGKLVDRDIESKSELTPIVDGAQKFVGWDQSQLKTPFVAIIFRFDSGRNFTMVAFRVANNFDHDIRVFKMVVLTFGWGYNGNEVTRQTGTKSESVQSDDRMLTSRWIEIDIRGQVGNFVKVDLYFGSQWLILSEVNFQSELLQLSDDHYVRYFVTDKVPIYKSRFHNGDDKQKWESNTALPLTHTLGLICGILALTILMGSFVLIYLHKKKKLLSPWKERVLQLKFPEDDNRFQGNDSQFYSSKLTKGTIIPFNISPYKTYVSQKNPNDLPSYHQSLLTPSHHIRNVQSPNILLKSSSNHNARVIDSCIYTSLPASDTDSLETQDHILSNNKQFVAYNWQNTPLTRNWTNPNVRPSDPFEKVYTNSNTLDDGNSYNLQCHPGHVAAHDLGTLGLIYTNRDPSQDYDSFMTQTFNDTDDDTGSLFFHGSSDFNEPYHESLIGCCGNSTTMDSSVNFLPNLNRSSNSLRLPNLDELIPLGTGRWGDLFVDISFTGNFGFDFEKNGHYESNGIENRAVLIKVLDDNCPFEIRDRFHHEYSVMAHVAHAGISRIISANIDLTDNCQFIISEYSIHGNLHNFFQNQSCGSKFKFFDSTLNFDGQNIFKTHQSTMTIILQLAEALKYLETVGIIHRDVSCRNCLIFHLSDRDLTIKLVDSAMGQAQYRPYYIRPRSVLRRSLVPELQSVSVSSALMPLRWSACETITQTLFSTKSDVYAFGITVWEIFNRSRVYPKSEFTDEQIVINALDITHNHVDPLPSLTILPNCAKEISDFIHQCIHPNPKCRPNFKDICTFLQNKVIKTV